MKIGFDLVDKVVAGAARPSDFNVSTMRISLSVSFTAAPHTESQSRVKLWPKRLPEQWNFWQKKYNSI